MRDISVPKGPKLAFLVKAAKCLFFPSTSLSPHYDHLVPNPGQRPWGRSAMGFSRTHSKPNSHTKCGARDSVMRFICVPSSVSSYRGGVSAASSLPLQQLCLGVHMGVSLEESLEGKGLFTDFLQRAPGGLRSSVDLKTAWWERALGRPSTKFSHATEGKDRVISTSLHPLPELTWLYPSGSYKCF